MRFSEAWLREWVSPAVTTRELTDQLSMAGLEVDEVAPVAPPFDKVVVGRVLSLEPHPDAQKLRVCRVDVGAGEPLQIICGAANVAAGMRVAVAVIGAELPGDFRIKRAKLRGVESFGMICSAQELGLAESSEGILPLPADAPVGEALRRYLVLDDHAIEVDLTPDRGDCLSVAGIAREVGVINGCAVTPPPLEPVAAVVDDRFPVRVDAPAACPRYACRVIRGIDPAAETPLWMVERLRRSGIRSLGPVVDVTNYVLLELGQPLHGFDLARVAGGIEVRMARAGERLELLNGETLEPDRETLVIADANGPVALAGIMGGAPTGVGEATRDILLESAFFAPLAIAGRARRYALHTDSSHRFERGVDPELQVRAIERATRLLLDIVGGEPGPVVEQVSPEALPARPEVRLRSARVAALLGVAVGDAEIEAILRRLEMEVVAIDGGWRVTPPSCRFDIAIEADLIEEIGRIYGYTRIPMHRGGGATATRAVSERAFDLRVARQLLIDRDYQEVITYSFVSPELQRQIDPEHVPIALANPISAEMAVMRTSLWPGLAQAAIYNRARQQERIRIFECGMKFIRQGDEIEQLQTIGGLICGGAEPEQWGAATRPVDFFDLKGDVERLLDLTGCGDAFAFRPAADPALHPGQCAEIVRDDRVVGRLGLVHPALQTQLDLARDTFLFEVELRGLADGRLPRFAPLSKFPATRRDLALVVAEETPFAAIRDAIDGLGLELVQDIRLFDVYTGENVEKGRKSLALGLILQDSSNNLTDVRVDAAMRAVVERLAERLGAQLRD